MLGLSLLLELLQKWFEFDRFFTFHNATVIMDTLKAQVNSLFVDVAE